MTDNTLKQKFLDLKKKERELQEELSKVKTEIRETVNQKLEETQGLAVGKKLAYNGVEYEVTRFHGESVITIYGKKFKKDGSLYAKECFITCATVNMDK